MSNYMKILVGVLMVAYLAQCKLQPAGEVKSVFRANDGLKIAAHYIGNARCRAYLQSLGREATEINRIINAHANLASHQLNGKNGELITKQFKQERNKPHAQLSGDRFLSRNSNTAFTMEDIEANCRRLVLSIDSHAPPTLKMTHGFVARNQQQLFVQDFGQQGFGTLQCVGNLCSFSNIAGIGGSKRYFALIEPARGHAHIQVEIGYYPHNSTQRVDVDKVELEHIHFRTMQRYQNLPQVLPTLRPRDPHLSYVRHLYVHHTGGEGLHKLPDDTVVELSLQVRDANGVVRRRYTAENSIKIRNTKLRESVTTLNVKNICNNFIKEDCGTQLEGFASRLLSMNAELVYVFQRKSSPKWWKKPFTNEDGGRIQGSIHIHRQAITSELLNNLLDRQGTLAIKGEGWQASFAFNNIDNTHLYLSLSRDSQVSPNHVYITTDRSCANDKVKNKYYFLMWRGGGDYAELEIDTKKLVDHFKKQPCLQQIARKKSNVQFLKALSPMLVFHNITYQQSELGDMLLSPPAGHHVWSYQLHEGDIDTWFEARGGIIIVPVSSKSPQSKTAPVLEVGFQSRQ